MKFVILLLSCFISVAVTGQAKSFSESWTGNWKGELNWYKTGKKEPQKISMELRIQAIHSSDSPDAWT